MSHPDLLRMPDGTLRAFFGGIRTTNPGETNNTMNTATAPAGQPMDSYAWTRRPTDLGVRHRSRRRSARKGRHPHLDVVHDTGPRLPLRHQPRRSRLDDPAERLLPLYAGCRRRRAERPSVGGIPLERERLSRPLRECDHPRRPTGWPKACPRLGRWQELDLPRQPDVDHRSHRSRWRLPVLRPGLSDVQDARTWKVDTAKPTVTIKADGNEHANKSPRRPTEGSG